MIKKHNMYSIGLGLDLNKHEDLMLKNALDTLTKQENRTVSYFVKKGLTLLINNSKEIPRIEEVQS